MLKIAIDAMGGDNGCKPIIDGIIDALKKIDILQLYYLVKKVNFYL